MMDWFTPLVGFLGLAIGFGYQEYRFRRERKDKYKDMVFEKRLAAHQDAYYWCMRLFNLMMPNRLMIADGRKNLNKETWEAHEWLTKNALYLDEVSAEKWIDFFEYVQETCQKYENETSRKDINVKEETKELRKHTEEVVAAIRKGVGYKYLPVIKK
jgi:hypothetical protein